MGPIVHPAQRRKGSGACVIPILHPAQTSKRHKCKIGNQLTPGQCAEGWRSENEGGMEACPGAFHILHPAQWGQTRQEFRPAKTWSKRRRKRETAWTATCSHSSPQSKTSLLSVFASQRCKIIKSAFYIFSEVSKVCFENIFWSQNMKFEVNSIHNA